MSATLLLLLASLSASWTPARLKAAVRRAGVLEGRELQSARRVCDLRIGGARYPVVATVERLRAVEPRLYRQVLVLNARGVRAIAFPVTPPAQPDHCDGDRLVFRGDTVRVGGEDGSVVRFGRGARTARVAPPDG